MIWTALVALALAADLEVRLEPVGEPPRGAREFGLPEPVDAAVSPGQLVLDGSREPIWGEAPILRARRGLLGRPGPRSQWGLQVMATPTGLAFAGTGMRERDAFTIGVDPDGSRRGWYVLRVDDDGARVRSCLPENAPSNVPFPNGWRPATWACGAWAAARVVRRDATFEAELSWAYLGRATDDLKLAWKVEAPDATGSIDPRGRAGDYPLDGALVRFDGMPERRETLRVAVDPEAERASVTLAAGAIAQAEMWTIQTWRNGQVLDRVDVELPAHPRAARASVELDAPGAQELWVVARPAGDVPPLGPGAFFVWWTPTGRASLGSPVFDEELIVHLHTRKPEPSTVVRVLSVDDTVLGETTVDLDRGAARLFIGARDDWPDEVRVEVGGWLGRSARAVRVKP